MKPITSSPQLLPHPILIHRLDSIQAFLGGEIGDQPESPTGPGSESEFADAREAAALLGYELSWDRTGGGFLLKSDELLASLPNFAALSLYFKLVRGLL